MSATIKNKKTVNKKITHTMVGPKVGNYEKHPFFIKKANEAKALIKVVGLPKKMVKSK